MDMACGIYWGQTKYILGFGMEGAGPVGKPDHNWENNIKMDLTETG
jgi:hypothetical protein